MPDGTKAQRSVDPIELWRQWNETTSRMWLSAIDNSKGATTDPTSFYQSWVKSVQSAQEQMKQNPLVMGSREMWKMWFGTTMEIWRQAAATSGDPMGLTTSWLKLMEDAQTRFFAGEVLPSDPFTLFRQWYEATSEQWSKSVEQIIGSEQFLEATAPFTESYTSLVRAFRRASEEYFQQLQLPTLSDIARVAELVVNLEEKVDKIDDAFEDLAERTKQTATSKAVTHLEKEIEGLATNKTVTALQKRLDQVEHKLDLVLTALKKIEATQSKAAQAQASSSEPAARKGQKKAPESQEVAQEA